MEKLNVGDEIAIAGILKVSAVRPNRNGTVSYSFDRGFDLHESMVEQMALKPYEKPILEEVVKEPTYTGKVVAVKATEQAFENDIAHARVGRIIEIVDGLIVGDLLRYGLYNNPIIPFKSFSDFAGRHRLNVWMEIKD